MTSKVPPGAELHGHPFEHIAARDMHGVCCDTICAGCWDHALVKTRPRQRHNRQKMRPSSRMRDIIHLSRCMDKQTQPQSWQIALAMNHADTSGCPRGGTARGRDREEILTPFDTLPADISNPPHPFSEEPASFLSFSLSIMLVRPLAYFVVEDFSTNT